MDIENQLNTFRNQAGAARGPGRAAPTTPTSSNAAHDYLIETLEFRRDGVSQIADQLPDAIAAQGDRRSGTERDRRAACRTS